MISLAVSLPFIFWAYNTVNPEIVNILPSGSDLETVQNDSPSNLSSAFDNVFLILFIGSFIVAIMSAFFIDSHPVFFFIGLLVFILFAAIMPFIVNLVDIIYGQELLQATLAGFPMMSFVISNYMTLTLVMGGTIIVALYAKRVVS